LTTTARDEVAAKAPTGRDSKAQGAAQRTPGWHPFRIRQAPTGRDSKTECFQSRHRNLAPLGLPGCFLFANPGLTALGCRISPRWGCPVEGPDGCRNRIGRSARNYSNAPGNPGWTDSKTTIGSASNRDLPAKGG